VECAAAIATAEDLSEFVGVNNFIIYHAIRAGNIAFAQSIRTTAEIAYRDRVTREGFPYRLLKRTPNYHAFSTIHPINAELCGFARIGRADECSRILAEWQRDEDDWSLSRAEYEVGLGGHVSVIDAIIASPHRDSSLIALWGQVLRGAARSGNVELAKVALQRIDDERGHPMLLDVADKAVHGCHTDVLEFVVHESIARNIVKDLYWSSLFPRGARRGSAEFVRAFWRIMMELAPINDQARYISWRRASAEAALNPDREVLALVAALRASAMLCI
jgi:hypothetical protein